jgi:hypothetical protein
VNQCSSDLNAANIISKFGMPKTFLSILVETTGSVVEFHASKYSDAELGPPIPLLSVATEAAVLQPAPNCIPCPP